MPLGRMRYRMLATSAFVQRWFPNGLQRGAARRAPLLVFDRKDRLQSEFLAQHLGLPADGYPMHHLPATGAFFKAVCLGLGYGLIPEQQYGSKIGSGELIDLAPQQPSDVALYWHTWKVQSPKLERLSARLLAAAREMLIE